MQASAGRPIFASAFRPMTRLQGIRMMDAMRLRSHLRGLRSLADRHGDVALALALTVLTQIEVWTISMSYLESPRLPIAATTLVMTVSLAWRRRAPLAMALAIAAAVVVQVLLASTPHPTSAPFIVWMVAAYSVAAYASRRDALVGGLALAAAVDLWAIADAGGSEFVFVTVILAGFWVAGRVVRSTQPAGRGARRANRRART